MSLSFFLSVSSLPPSSPIPVAVNNRLYSYQENLKRWKPVIEGRYWFDQEKKRLYLRLEGNNVLQSTRFTGSLLSQPGEAYSFVQGRYQGNLPIYNITVREEKEIEIEVGAAVLSLPQGEEYTLERSCFSNCIELTSSSLVVEADQEFTFRLLSIEGNCLIITPIRIRQVGPTTVQTLGGEVVFTCSFEAFIRTPSEGRVYGENEAGSTRNYLLSDITSSSSSNNLSIVWSLYDSGYVAARPWNVAGNPITFTVEITSLEEVITSTVSCSIETGGGVIPLFSNGQQRINLNPRETAVFTGLGEYVRKRVYRPIIGRGTNDIRVRVNMSGVYVE